MIEIEATVDLPLPPAEVRRHAVKRWEDVVRIGNAAWKAVQFGFISAGVANNDLGLAANAIGNSPLEADVDSVGIAPVMVETNQGQVFIYEFEDLGGTTRMRMIQRQTNYVARMPGMKRILESGMRREVARFESWARKEAAKKTD